MGFWRRRFSDGQCRPDRGLFSCPIPQRQPHVDELNGARLYSRIVQSKIVMTRPSAIFRPVHQPFPHVTRLLGQAMLSPRREEPTVRTTLTVATRSMRRSTAKTRPDDCIQRRSGVCYRSGRRPIREIPVNLARIDVEGFRTIPRNPGGNMKLTMGSIMALLSVAVVVVAQQTATPKSDTEMRAIVNLRKFAGCAT